MQPGDETKPEDPNTDDRSLPEADEPQSPWQYSSETGDGFQAPADLPTVTWSASEFIDHQKNAGWFFGLAGATILAGAILYFLTKDIVTVVVVAIAAVLFGITAGRKPRTLNYQLDHRGVQIAEKSYPYVLFKSFSVLEEGAFSSIQLMPLKRFMPPITLYYPPETEDQIINTLGNYLPHEDRQHDAVDRLMKRIRF